MSEWGDDTIAMLRESVQAFVPSDGSLRRIRALRFEAPGFAPEIWRSMCEMGWLGLMLPEECGGANLGMPAYCALAEELGKGLAPEPLIAATFAARLLPEDGLAPVLTGSRIILPAWQEQVARLDAAGATRIEASRVTGTKRFVVQGGGADAFVVAAGNDLAMVEATARGVAIETQRLVDGTFYATVTFEGAGCTPLPPADLATALDEAALATAAYLLGVMQRAFEITLDYLRMRRQFDRPIGSFQALQHRCADMKMQIELTRASIASAAATLDVVVHGLGADPASRRAKISAAKARASDAAMLVTRESVQMHGAIGYTDEADIGLFLRKAMTLAGLYGSAPVHRRRYASIAREGRNVP